MLKEGEESLFTHPLPPIRAERLKLINEGCEKVLVDLQTLVEKYESLGTQSKRTWDRMKWGKEDLAEIRARLTSNVSLLTAFISTSQVSVQTKLDKFLRELRQGKREPSIVSLSTVDSLSADDKAVWRTIRKELEEIGVSIAAFDANRNFIFDWFVRAVEAGNFEEQNVRKCIMESNHSNDQERKSSEEDPDVDVGRQTAAADVKSLQGIHEGHPLARQWLSQLAHGSEPCFPKHGPKTFEQICVSIHTRQESERSRPHITTSLAWVSHTRQRLIKAVATGDFAKALMVLEKKASSNHLDMGTLDRALWSATRQVESSCSCALIAALITKGANVNYTSRDIHERTPLWNSVANGSFDNVRLLIENGADVNYMGLDRISMFQVASGAVDFAPRAALEQRTSILQILISAGLDVNTVYEYGLRGPIFAHRESCTNDLSLIQEAAYLGATPAIEVLLEHGAEIDAASSRHGTALMLALLEKHEEAAQALLLRGADPNFQAPANIFYWMVEGGYRNPIEAAVLSRKVSMLRLLLDWGVVPDESTLGIAINSPVLATQKDGDEDSPYAIIKLLQSAVRREPWKQ